MKLSLDSSGLARSACVALAAVASACGGSVGTDARPAPDPLSRSSTAALSYTREEVGEAKARCESPHGAVERYATLDQLVALLSGTWIYCGGRGGRPLASADGAPRVGAEFTSDGHFYWLSSDPVSGVARGEGIAGRAGYDIEPPKDGRYNDSSFQIDVWFADRSVMPVYATFEDGPRRMALEGIDGYFVPLVKAPD